MKNPRTTKKMVAVASLCLAGGTLFQGNCANALFSLPICGGVLTFCTPFDQINVLYPLLTTPDFNADPSCTIPLGCQGGTSGNGEFFGDDRFPGGGAPDEPEDESDGIGGQGGGGGV